MQHSPTNNFKPFDASKYKIGIVWAQFNSDLTNKILASALQKLKEYKVKEKNIKILPVAGCVEIPLILKMAGKAKKFDILIAIGAIIKGETDHYEFVAKITVDGIMQTMLKQKLPIGFAVLTLPNKKMSAGRLTIGAGAVVAAMQNSLLLREIKK